MVLVVVIDGKTYVVDNDKMYQADVRVKIPKNAIGVEAEQIGERFETKGIPVYDTVSFSGASEATVFGIVPNLGVTLLKGTDAYFLVRGLMQSTQKVYVVGGRVFTTFEEMVEALSKDVQLVRQVARKTTSRDVKAAAVIALSRAGECEEAVEVYESIQEKFPEESLAVTECYIKLNRKTEALKIYSLFSEEKYRELEAELRAEVNKTIDEFERTENVKALLNSAKLLPNYDAPILKLAFHYERKGDWKEALKYYEEAVRRNPSLVNAMFYARALIRSGNAKKALEIINDLEGHAQLGELHYLKGLALHALGLPIEAEKEFIVACRNGVLDACSRVKPYLLTESPGLSSPDELVGRVVYGYKLERLLGEGGMGYVFEATKGGKRFAMKVMRRDFKFDEILREVAKMQEVSKSSTRFVRIMASFVDENLQGGLNDIPAIVMEFMEGGDLRKVLTSDDYSTLRSSSYWPAFVAKVFSMVAEGVEQLHSHGFIHADLKPSNVLFTKPLPKFGPQAIEALEKGEVEPKIGDLGSAVKIGSLVIHYTPYYAHPLQRFGDKADTEFDAYSLTVSIYVSLVNNFPLPEWLENELEEAVSKPELRERAYRDFLDFSPRLDYVPEEFHDLIYDGIKGLASVSDIRRELDSIYRDILRSIEGSEVTI